MQSLTLVKIGGNVIDQPAALSAFLRSYARLRGPKVLVHGGGKIASTLGSRLGVTPRMADGRRITDEETLKVVTMVYAGLVNKDIVSRLQAEGVRSEEHTSELQSRENLV